MAPRFDPIDLEWEGKKYTIQPDQVMRVIARIEDFVTYGEMERCARNGTAPLAKISRAFAAVLNMVGADVSETAVYVGLFTAGDVRDRTLLSVLALMSIMIPPEHMRRPAGDADQGKQKATATPVSSSKPGRQRSRKAGARTNRSGR